MKAERNTQSQTIIGMSMLFWQTLDAESCYKVAVQAQVDELSRKLASAEAAREADSGGIERAQAARMQLQAQLELAKEQATAANGQLESLTLVRPAVPSGTQSSVC